MTEKRALIIFAIWNAISVLGYATFGRNPQWLVGLPYGFEFYGISFYLFAQSQVWLGFAVMLVYLRRVLWRAWLPAFFVVFAISAGSELSGTSTGFPFGPYHYTDLLGPKIAGLVPFTIPTSWFYMAIPSYLIARKLLSQHAPVWAVWLLGAAFITAWDVSLDPAMSYLVQYWQWHVEGPYYTMPWVNFAGWFVTGLALMGAFTALGIERWGSKLPIGGIAGFYAINVLMPFAMNVAGGLWFAVLLAIATYAALYIVSQWLRSAFAPKDAADIQQWDASEPSALVRQALGLSRRQRNAVFRAHSKSFYFASRWFKPAMRASITDLYVMCRIADDLADRSDLSCQDRTLLVRSWQAMVHEAYIAQTNSWLDPLMQSMKRAQIALNEIDALFEGVLSDQSEVRIQDEQELARYCYNVAGAIGVWMTKLSGVQDPIVHHGAQQLGHAMQLTNILRDVREDALNNRRYLPASVLQQFGLGDDIKSVQQDSQALRHVIEQLSIHASRAYTVALNHVGYLPPAFGAAVSVAGFVYRGILDEIEGAHYNIEAPRCHTSFGTKLALAYAALRHNRVHQNKRSNQALPAVRYAR